METIKKPFVKITINKDDVTLILNKYVISVRYTDFLKGQTDELELCLKNIDGIFYNDCYPIKGNTINATIGYTGEDSALFCGTFTVDEVSFSGGLEGEIITIRAIAASIKQATREANSRSYVNKTIFEIAKEIGQKHGFTVAGKADTFKLSNVIQYNESDLAFLYRLSEQYGYIFKVTDNLLTFTKTEQLEKAEPLTILGKKDLSSFNFKDTSSKTYKNCIVRYYDPKKGTYKSVTVEGQKTDVKGDTLKINSKFNSREEAEKIAQAGLKNGQKTVTGTINLKKGNPYFISGANFTLEEFGLLNGKYQVTKAIHEVTKEDYTTNGEVEKCLN